MFLIIGRVDVALALLAQELPRLDEIIAGDIFACGERPHVIELVESPVVVRLPRQEKTYTVSRYALRKEQHGISPKRKGWSRRQLYYLR